MGLGIGFREWVPIRNIIGGAAGAHSDEVRATTKRLSVLIVFEWNGFVYKHCTLSF